MGTWALVKDGVVKNVVVWDGDTNKWTPPGDHTAINLANVDPAPSTGWLYESGTFTEPAPPVVEPPPPPPVLVPRVISDRQFYQQLAVAGICTQADALSAVKTGFIPSALQAILDTITDPDQHFAMEMLLSGATEFQRSHPATTSIGYAFGWNDAQIDDFFTAAAAL